MNSCHKSVARLLASHPTKISSPARGNMTRGPVRSRNLPRKGAAKAPTNPEAENTAEVARALLWKLSRSATKKTGSLFLIPPSTVRLVKDRAKIVHP